MGLSIDGTRFVAQARRYGVSFGTTLSLGRQHMLVGPERLEAILREAGAWPPPDGEDAVRQAFRASSWRFEPFARALGAKEVMSCDASDYEGASVIHDLNQPIRSDLEGRFDVVLDGGTLEHVFNFPTAIANCMRMLKTGGHLIIITPANNACGHGFYQFSPEVFYRVLSAENGFEVVRMIALEDNVGASTLLGVPYPFPITGPWYAVRDPARIHKRVTLSNRDAVALMVLARKTAQTAIFSKTPQQSDYVPQWEAGAAIVPPSQSSSERGLAKWLRSKFNETFCREVLPRLAVVLDPFRLTRFRRQSSFTNREFFEPVDKERPDQDRAK